MTIEQGGVPRCEPWPVHGGRFAESINAAFARWDPAHHCDQVHNPCTLGIDTTGGLLFAARVTGSVM